MKSVPVKGYYARRGMWRTHNALRSADVVQVAFFSIVVAFFAFAALNPSFSRPICWFFCALSTFVVLGTVREYLSEFLTSRREDLAEKRERTVRDVMES